MKSVITFCMWVSVIVGCLAVTSCGNGKDSLSGVYGYEDYSGWGQCYDFVNSNTVVFYGNARWGEYKKTGHTKQIGSSSWYTTYDSPGKTYTYTFEDNKVIIPMQGKIFTKSGDSLLEEGTSHVYRK